jgi:hypothetical protein
MNSPEGKCILSNNRSAAVARFSTVKRPFSAALSSRYKNRSSSNKRLEKDFYNNNLPGPGYYHIVSEFGRYNFWEPK